MVDTKRLLFWYPVMMFTKKLEGASKKWTSHKKLHFWSKKGLFRAITTRKQPTKQPNGHLPKNWRYPKMPQDIGNYDSIESSSSELKKWLLYWWSVKISTLPDNSRFSDQKFNFQTWFFKEYAIHTRFKNSILSQKIIGEQHFSSREKAFRGVWNFMQYCK